MVKSFDDGWMARGGKIRLHEEAAHAAGGALGQAKRERMGFNCMSIARERSLAHGFARDYNTAPSDSRIQLTADLNCLVAAN